MTTDGFAHHGILAHQDDGMASKRDTDLLHLLRSDIVSIDLLIRKEYMSKSAKFHITYLKRLKT